MAVEAPRIIPDIPQSLDMKRLLLRRKLVWAVSFGLASVVMWLVSGFVLWPMGIQVQTDLTRTEQAVLAATQRSSVLTGIDPEDQQNFLRVAQTLPASKEPLVVLQALTDIAQEVSVTLSEYDTNPGLISTGAAVANRGATASRVQNMNVAVEMTGTFQQIREALDLLESAAPIMEVTELSLSPNNRTEIQGGETAYRARLQLTSYFLPPTAAGTGAGVARALTPQQQEVFDRIILWRNRLPDQPLTPEVFSRTNLFQIEVQNPTSAQPDSAIQQDFQQLPTIEQGSEAQEVSETTISPAPEEAL